MFREIVTVFWFVLTISQTHGQQTTICQTTFLTQFYNCIQKVSLVPQNILWFTKNGTIGTKPANEATFKTSACSLRQQISDCSTDAMNKIINSTACADKDKNSIKDFFGSVFGPYDEKCAHPCRWTLFGSFKRCHDNIGISSGPFLLNTAIASVIGSNETETALFCSNRGRLLMCMTKEKSRCPEADFVMKQVGFDLNVMKKSTDVFCSYPKVYLDSILCFNKLSAEVRKCHQGAANKMADLSSKFQIIVNENDFNRQFCSIRQESVSCDLMVWTNNQDKEKCNKAVVGLRTEYGCKLLPSQCTRHSLAPMTSVCSEDKFMMAARDNYGSGAANPTSVSALWAISVLILLNI
ncbi:uncharacterized protein LOC121390381 isoform X2 [Gigantopelta aegis]|uniref:uncharacterized protein LOC121390381 isoform X2 n=1 Tax=Gigantopelta aegis TaxID=1735272 RepID=UPI001B88D707|nr:uncharacterized protein LOC121390381 isoform X2 [Gigantopelta aegis]